MRIGINALYLIPDRVGGTETYLRNLVRELGRIDTQNEYVLFTNQLCAHSFDPLPSHWKEVVCPFSPENKMKRVLWEQWIFPGWVKRHQIDVLHSPAYVAPKCPICASVVTIHDMHYHYFPGTFSVMKQIYWENAIPRSAQRVEKILTVSQCSKKDICELLKVPESKVRVTYAAVGDIFQSTYSADQVQSFLQQSQIQSPYILSVATFNKHKNMDGVVRCFNRFKKQSGLPHQLVLIGIKGDYYPQVMEEVQHSEYQVQIKILDPVPIAQLPLLYTGADLFMLMSYFEGFGLPVLEAMACGVPVICSNRTSLPEVVSDAGRVVDPDDEPGVALAMQQILQSPEVINDLIQKGKKRAMEFSWKKMAEGTLAAYTDTYTAWKGKRS